jgi:hypothetical protein
MSEAEDKEVVAEMLRALDRDPIERLSGSLEPLALSGKMSILDQIKAFTAGSETPPEPSFRFEEELIRAAPPGVQTALNVAGMGAETGVDIAAEATGQKLGGLAGGMLVPGGRIPGRILGGVAAGTISSLLRKQAKDEEISPLGTGVDIAASVLPEALEQPTRAVGQAFLRRTPFSQITRRDEAKEIIRRAPGQIFQPKSREDVGALFDKVRESEVSLDLTPISEGLLDLTQGKSDDILRTVKRLDNENLTGGRWEALIRGVLDDSRGVHDMGDLQNLHSQIRIRIKGLKSPEARDTLQDFNNDIDRAIFQGLTDAAADSPAGIAGATLREAREGWARIRGSEELSDMLEKAITVTSDASRELLTLPRLVNELRRNKSNLAKAVNRSLKFTPGGQAAWEKALGEVKELFEVIERPLAADVTGISRTFPFNVILRELSDALLRQPAQTGAMINRLRPLAKDVVLNASRQAGGPGVVAATISGLLRRGLQELQGGGDQGVLGRVLPQQPQPPLAR